MWNGIIYFSYNYIASKFLWMLFTNERKEGEKVFPTPSPSPLWLLLLQNTQMKKWSKDEYELTLNTFGHTYEKGLGSSKRTGEWNPLFVTSWNGTTWKSYHQKSPCFIKSRISALVNYTVQMPQSKYKCHHFFNAVVLEDSWCPKYSSDLHLTNFSNQLIQRFLAH